MKKLFAALLSLCLMLTGVAAIAENTADTVEPTVINISDYEAKIAATEGQTGNIATTGLKMFVPAEFKDTKLSEEAEANGTFMILKVDDKDVAVTAQVLKIDIEKFAAVAAADGHNPLPVVINGVEYVAFNLAEDGKVAANFALSTTDGNTLVFSFACSENLKDAYTETFNMMVASMQPAK